MDRWDSKEAQARVLWWELYPVATRRSLIEPFREAQARANIGEEDMLKFISSSIHSRYLKGGGSFEITDGEIPPGLHAPLRNERGYTLPLLVDEDFVPVLVVKKTVQRGE